MRRRSPAIRKIAATGAARADMPQHLAADEASCVSRAGRGHRGFTCRRKRCTPGECCGRRAVTGRSAVDADARRADPRVALRRSRRVTRRASCAGKAPGSRARRSRRCRSRRCRTCSASSRRRACISSAITPACPTIDPHQHRLMIHGLVRAPRIYTMDDIMRFPSVSRIHFIECGANTGMEWANVAVPTVQYTHGMLGCSEWTGVPLVDAARRGRRRPQARAASCWPKAPTARR